MYKSNSAIKPYLVYRIGDDLFASKADQIRKILDVSCLYSQKDMRPFNYSLNLCGEVVPIYDIAEKLGLSKTKINFKTCILIMQVSNQSYKKYGFIVSEVKSLIDIKSKDIKDMPVGAKYKLNSIDKFIEMNEQIVRRIDFEKLLYDNSKRSLIKLHNKPKMIYSS